MTFPFRRLIAVACVAALTACGSSTKTAVPPDVSGAKSGVFTIDALVMHTMDNRTIRSSALLGLFVTEYLSFSSNLTAAQGALTGIAVDRQIMDKQHMVTDPDFELLQAFADALQVDVADLLNRSQNRQEALDVFTTALTNVATKANERFKELTSAQDELKKTLSTQSKQRSAADSALKSAINKKQFADAGELQKKVLETQQAYAETDLKSKQTQDVLDTMDKFLALYGQKILAIQQNRELLIAGNRVVDVPGIDELRIIEHKKATNTGRGGAKYDNLFPAK